MAIVTITKLHVDGLYPAKVMFTAFDKNNKPIFIKQLNGKITDGKWNFEIVDPRIAIINATRKDDVTLDWSWAQ